MKRIPGKVIMANLFTTKIETVNKNSAKYHSLKVDDPVLYSRGCDIYTIKHFAGFADDGTPTVFIDGKSSMTAGEYDIIRVNDGAVIMLIADQYLQ